MTSIGSSTFLYSHVASFFLFNPVGLAFDKNGWRIGHGKGYYDRFLQRIGQFAKEKNQQPPVTGQYLWVSFNVPGFSMRMRMWPQPYDFTFGRSCFPCMICAQFEAVDMLCSEDFGIRTLLRDGHLTDFCHSHIFLNHNMTVALALSEQIIDGDIPRDEHDRKPDYLITPDKIIQ